MSLDRHVNALSRLTLFSAFEPEALKLIAFAAEIVRFAPGDILFRIGEESDAGFLVLSGLIMLDPGHGSMESGKIVGPGILIGETSVLTSTLHPTTAIARETTSALKIKRTLVRRVLEEFPESARRVQDALRQKIGNFGREIERAREAL
jgi:CRP-like cAMP-binding protein